MKHTANTVLITGGVTGIGLAFTQAFLARGDHVIVCGRNTLALNGLKSEVPEVEIIHCDLSQESNIRALVSEVQAKYPQLNLLVNNAGVQYSYDFGGQQCNTIAIDEEVAVNFLAPVKLIDLLLPCLMQQPNAAIINITSALAVVPKKSAPVYCATKAALHNFTKALRYQLEGSNVAVYDVVPSLVDTAMTEGRGKGKIRPELLVSETLTAMSKGKSEILIGKTKLLFKLNQLFPSLAHRLLKNS